MGNAGFPQLDFSVTGVEVVPFAAAPTLCFKLHVTESTAIEIHSIALRCQIRIDPTKRKYASAEQEKLLDLYGEPSRWGQTLHSMLWTHTTCIVKGFAGETIADLHVPCTSDFNLAAAKYFAGLDAGEVPLTFLFSGTVFFATADGSLQVCQIPWEKEAAYRLPVATWKQMMDTHFPNTAWLCLRKDVFEQLAQFKSRHGLPTWEAAVEKLIEENSTCAQ